MRGGGTGFWDDHEGNCPLEVSTVRSVETFPAGPLEAESCLGSADWQGEA